MDVEFMICLNMFILFRLGCRLVGVRVLDSHDTRMMLLISWLSPPVMYKSLGVISGNIERLVTQARIQDPASLKYSIEILVFQTCFAKKNAVPSNKSKELKHVTTPK